MRYSHLEKTKYYVDRAEQKKLSDRQRAWARIKSLELIAEVFETNPESNSYLRLEAISNRAEAKVLRKKHGF